MKALYFSMLPPDHQALKDNASSKFSVMGATVYAAEVLKALLRYSNYDVIYIPHRNKLPAGDLRDSELFAINASRIKLLAEHEFGEMRRADHLILASPKQYFSDLIRIRRLCGRPETPITAVIHSIDHARQLLAMLDLVLSPLKHFDALICSSRAGHQAIMNFVNHLRNRFARAHFGELEMAIQTPIIPLGVEIEDFMFDSSAAPTQAGCSVVHEPTILYFGRFSMASKADLFPLVVVFAELLESHADAVLILAGDDTQHRLARELESFAGDLGCANKVRIVPNPTILQKRQLYRQADVFVSISDNLQETFGITIVEAMAAGLPVVASDWSGYRDLVVDGETGYLIPTFMPKYPRQFDDFRGGNMGESDLLAATTVVDTKRLREALERLITDENLRRSLGQAGLRRARDLYDWRRVIAQYESLWSTLAEEASRPGQGMTTDQLDLTGWSYEEVFGHYATTLIRSDLRVQLTDRGRSWRRKPEMLARVAVPKSWFCFTELCRILDLLEFKGQSAIRDVFATGDDRRNADWTDERCAINCFSHLCRLMKYGLVEASPSPETGFGT